MLQIFVDLITNTITALCNKIIKSQTQSPKIYYKLVALLHGKFFKSVIRGSMATEVRRRTAY